MRRPHFLWITALGLLLGSLSPCAGVAQSPNTTTSDTVALARTGTVEIDNEHGSITVTSWDRAQVGYVVTLEPAEGDSTVTTRPIISHSPQEVSFGGDPWSISIPGLLTISPSGTEDLIAHYRITMPETAALQINDYESTIEVSGLHADVEIDTHQGEASVDSVEGTLTWDSHTGSLKATVLRGGIQLDTHEGTASVSFDQFTTSSEAETHSGTLRLFLPADAGFVLSTDFSSADFTLAEAFGTLPEGEERRAFNGGGPELYLDAFSGRVEIHPRASQGASSP